MQPSVVSGVSNAKHALSDKLRDTAVPSAARRAELEQDGRIDRSADVCVEVIADDEQNVGPFRSAPPGSEPTGSEETE